LPARNFFAEFKRGREPRSERPKTATTPENIAKVHDMLLDDRRVKVREIGNAIGISNDQVHFFCNKNYI